MNQSETSHSIVITDRHGTVLRVYNLGYLILNSDEYNCLWNIASRNGLRLSMVVVEEYSKLGSVGQAHLPGCIADDMKYMFGEEANEATA